MLERSILLKKPSRTYSPLRYPGGKAALSSFFFEIISSNKIVGCTYTEPFAGGAGAALTLLMWEKVDKILINDYDPGIYAFWNSIVHRPEEFLEKLKEVDVSVDEWKRQNEIYHSQDSSEIELGFSTFFLNRTNRSGIIKGRPIGGFDQSGQWKINARFNKESLSKRIKKISSYKHRISVRKTDGIQLMKNLYKDKSFLFYIDPPYYMKGKSLYFNHYESSDHVLLASFLNENPNFNWILTYDNVPQVVSLYPDRAKFSFGLYYHTNSPKIGNEVLIKSDSIEFSHQLSLNFGS
jgi:DNA adenine methylase